MERAVAAGVMVYSNDRRFCGLTGKGNRLLALSIV